mmetsp:Transcript_70354/g.131612  ORF Transcript_70354/g.131612 Transcript_70354/m.131612 type:complete len:317 (+) Transcript_70354:3-953(+)
MEKMSLKAACPKFARHSRSCNHSPGALPKRRCGKTKRRVANALSPSFAVQSKSGLRTQTDRAIVMKSVSQHGVCLANAPPELRGDKEIVIRAVSVYGRALRWASEELKADRDVVLAAVYHDGYAFRFASKQLLDDKEVAKAAVSTDQEALEWASEQLQNDKDIVMTAVTYHGGALRHASSRLKLDKEVLLVALRTWAFGVNILCPSLETDTDILDAALQDSASFVLRVTMLSGRSRLCAFSRHAYPATVRSFIAHLLKLEPRHAHQVELYLAGNILGTDNADTISQWGLVKHQLNELQLILRSVPADCHRLWCGEG